MDNRVFEEFVFLFVERLSRALHLWALQWRSTWPMKASKFIDSAVQNMSRYHTPRSKVRFSNIVLHIHPKLEASLVCAIVESRRTAGGTIMSIEIVNFPQSTSPVGHTLAWPSRDRKSLRRFTHAASTDDASFSGHVPSCSLLRPRCAVAMSKGRVRPNADLTFLKTSWICRHQIFSSGQIWVKRLPYRIAPQIPSKLVKYIRAAVPEF